MTETSASPPPPPADASASRVFPCARCGADLTFHIGAQGLKCPYCGHEQPLNLDEDAFVAEQNYEATLARLADQRASTAPPNDAPESREIHCGDCGATVRFIGTLTSSACAYCATPLQLEDVHDAKADIPVDGVLPFQIDRQQAHTHLRDWVRTRWFAPGTFKRQGADGKFNGVYLPHWTFDSMTATRYSGMRGDHYYVTVGSGKSRRRVRRTRWTPASGAFQRFFDDVLVVAGRGLPDKRLAALAPWPLDTCIPFTREALAGLMARTYDVALEDGFVRAQALIRAELETDVRRRIGGAVQQIHSLNTRHDAITYKHLLLPVWMMAYRFKNKAYQVVINAATGEVQGDRPYSWVKITLTCLAAAAAIATIALLAAR